MIYLAYLAAVAILAAAGLVVRAIGAAQGAADALKHRPN
jgi:hypothetical protein